MAQVTDRFITCEGKILKHLIKCGLTRVAQPLLPEMDGDIGVRSVQAVSSCCPEWVKGATAVTSENLLTSWKILDGEAKCVKFNGNIVITGEGTHGDQILDEVRGEQNVSQLNWRGRGNGGGCSMCDRQSCSIANSNERVRRRGHHGVQHTRISSHAGGGSGVEESVVGAAGGR